jgi:integrase
MNKKTKAFYVKRAQPFFAWCSARGICPSEATSAHIEAFLIEKVAAGWKGQTIRVAVLAIDTWLVGQGCGLPCTRSERVRRAARGLGGNKSARKVIPLSDIEVSRMIDGCPETLIGLRDQAALALAYETRMRARKVAEMTVADLRASGIKVSAVDQWLEAAGIEDGYLFRAVRRGGHVLAWGIGDHGIRRIVRKRAAQAGIGAAYCNAESLRLARSVVQ